MSRIAHFKGLVYFLVAYWFYIDGVDTIIRMAVDYGMSIGLESKHLILSLLLVQFVGFPATIVFTHFAQKWDTKKAILLAIAIYFFITIGASMMDSIEEFYILAVMIALVQGGVQALSRSYYSRMIPDRYAAEFFGFYNFVGKSAAILGPFVIGVVTLLTKNSRLGILSVAIFFIIGGWMLLKVDEKKVAKELKSALD